MAHETPTLEAKPRDKFGSRYARRVRAAGGLPAVIYGHGAEPKQVILDEKAMLAALKHGSHVVNVKFNGGAPETCLVKDLQFGYLGDNVIHVDLARVNLDEVVTINVVLHYVGTPEQAKKAGNIVTHDLAQLEVRCKVRDIPEEVRIDLSIVMKEMTLTLGEIKLPPGVTATLPPETVLSRIQMIAEEVVGEAVPAAADAVTAPEVITAKKEEMPELGAAPGKPGAKAERLGELRTMKIVVGLGNPGIEYDRSRHNVGFEVIDRLARRTVDASRAIAKSRFSGSVLETDVDTQHGPERVLYLKPLTYMNRSGQAIAEALRFYKLDAAKDLFVIVDDLALPCGAIRIRPDGSAGGHNGLADVEEKLGTVTYPRCRIGIDGPGQIPQKEYVLGRFRPDQQPLVESAIEQAVQATLAWITSGIETAMNRFNSRAPAA